MKVTVADEIIWRAPKGSGLGKKAEIITTPGVASKLQTSEAVEVA